MFPAVFGDDRASDSRDEHGSQSHLNDARDDDQDPSQGVQAGSNSGSDPKKQRPGSKLSQPGDHSDLDFKLLQAVGLVPGCDSRIQGLGVGLGGSLDPEDQLELLADRHRRMCETRWQRKCLQGDSLSLA
eukprot:1071389-Rhodomonas_salina.2